MRFFSARIDRELAALRVDLPEEARPKVFVSFQRPEGGMGALLTCGGNTFLDEMVTLGGGRNIFHDETKSYPTVSKESLVLRAPDVIVELRSGETIDAAKRERLIADWAPLRSLPAVQKGRIVFVTEDFVQIPGPRLVQTARILRRAIGAAPDTELP